MEQKKYPSVGKEHLNRVAEPAVSYTASTYLSLEEVNLSDEVFAACIKQAEDDFAHDRCYSSVDLRRMIKEERGWR